MNRPVAVAREQFKKRLKSEEQDGEQLIQVSFSSSKIGKPGRVSNLELRMRLKKRSRKYASNSVDVFSC